jgi:hypothetical protein
LFEGDNNDCEGKLASDAGELNEDTDVDPMSVYIGHWDHSVTSLDLASNIHEVEDMELTLLWNKETGEHKGAALSNPPCRIQEDWRGFSVLMAATLLGKIPGLKEKHNLRSAQKSRPCTANWCLRVRG